MTMHRIRPFECTLGFDPRYLVERSAAYEARPAATSPQPVAVPAPRQEAPPADINEAAALFEYLSPQVRRFAVAMQARLERDDTASLETMQKRLMVAAARLFESVAHRGVTDRFLRPLGPDHPDRTPRRILDVLQEAANVACRCLLIAKACGSLE